VWALDRHDPDRWLTPELDSRAGMLTLIQHFDSNFKRHLDQYKYPGRYAGADAQVSRAEASLDVDMLETRLARTRYLYGEQVALADMAIAPFVRQFANVDAAWFASQPWPGAQRWLGTIVASARFERIMRPVEAWVPGTPGVRFPFP
jgi:glutathione S-transferase